MMIPEITIKIAFTQPGGERAEPTVTSVDVAPPAAPSNGAEQIPPVPSADDGGLAADVPPPPAPAGSVDADIPPLPSTEEEDASGGEPPETPPAGPKPRRTRTD